MKARSFFGFSLQLALSLFSLLAEATINQQGFIFVDKTNWKNTELLFTGSCSKGTCGCSDPAVCCVEFSDKWIPNQIPGVQGKTLANFNAKYTTVAMVADEAVSLYCWGSNESGVCGYGLNIMSSVGNKAYEDAQPKVSGVTIRSDFVTTPMNFQTIREVTNPREISVAFTTVGMITTDGSIAAWGVSQLRETGWMGFVPGITSDVPLLEFMTTDRAIALNSGTNHYCALFWVSSESRKRLRCWGWGLSGQLGYADQNLGRSVQDNLGTYLPSAPLAGGLPISSLPYVQFFGVSQTPNVESFDAAGSQTCALFDNGKLRCWGLGTEGQNGPGLLFLGSNAIFPGQFKSIPFINFGALTDTIVHYEMTEYGPCVLFSNYKVKCWGHGKFHGYGYGGAPDPWNRDIGNDPTDLVNLPFLNFGTTLPAYDLYLARSFPCVLFYDEAKRIATGDPFRFRCWGHNKGAQMAGLYGCDPPEPPGNDVATDDPDSPPLSAGPWGAMPSSTKMPKIFTVIPAYSTSHATISSVFSIRGPVPILLGTTEVQFKDITTTGGLTLKATITRVTGNRFDGLIPIFAPVGGGNYERTLEVRVLFGSVLLDTYCVMILRDPPIIVSLSPPSFPLRGTKADVQVTGFNFGERMTPRKCFFSPFASGSTLAARTAAAAVNSPLSHSTSTFMLCIGVPPAPGSPTVPFYGTLMFSVNHNTYSPLLSPTLAHNLYNTNFKFSYYADDITSVSPKYVPGIGGVTLTLEGVDGSLLTAPNVKVQFRSEEVTTLVDGTLLPGGLKVTCTVPNFKQVVTVLTLPQDMTVSVSLNSGTDYSVVTGTITVFELPSPTAASPANLPVGFPAITGLKIFGDNFIDTGGIKIEYKLGASTVASSCSFSSGISILCSGPAYMGQPSATIRISIDSGVTWSTNSIVLPYFDVISLSTGGGPVTGGTVLTLVGTNFVYTGEEICRFDGITGPTTAARYISPTQISCPTPALPAGVVSVELANSGLNYKVGPSTFTYYAVPTISALGPLALPAFPAPPVSAVTVSGTSFPGASVGTASCVFGKTSVAAASRTTTRVVCPPPTLAGASLVSVSVSFNSGADLIVLAQRISFFTVSSVDPKSGISGSTDLTVSGVGFVAGSTTFVCRVGTKTSAATILNTATLTCKLPAGLAPSTTSPFALSGDGFSFTSTALQVTTYPALAPDVTAVTPAWVPAFKLGDPVPIGGGQPILITLSGVNYPLFPAGFDRPTCRIGFSYAAAVSSTATSVVCTVPPDSHIKVVDVSFNNGANWGSSSRSLNYIEANLLEPATGPRVGGMTITVYGNAFIATPAASCRFTLGTVTAYSPATMVTSQRLTCASPASPPLPVPGSYQVSVTLDSSLVATQPNLVMWATSPTTLFDSYPTPEVTAISPRTAPSSVGSVTVYGLNFKGPVASLYCSFGSLLVQASLFVGPTELTCPVPSGLGAHPVEVSCNDRAQFSTSGSVFQFFSILFSSPVRGPSTGGTVISVFGSGFSSDNPRCQIGTMVVAARYVGSAQVECRTLPVTPVQVNLPVSVSMAGSMFSLSSGTANDFSYYSAPVISALSPSTGPTAGVTITVSASNLVNSGVLPMCRIGLTDAAALGVDYIARTVTCAVPSGSGSLIPVEISQNSGADFTSSGLTFAYIGVNSIFPALGPLAGNTLVEVSGFGFSSTATLNRCRFGTVTTVATVRSSLSMTCSSPTGVTVPGLVGFAVSQDGGVSWTAEPIQYRWYLTPALSGITPSAGPSFSAKVSITGTNLVDYGSPVHCRFGQLFSPATVAAGVVTCMTPQGSGAAIVDVSLNDKGDWTTTSVIFNFFVIYSVSPALGPSAGGSRISITGSGFQASPGLACSFGSQNVPATFISAVQISCLAPPLNGTVSTLPVEVSLDSVFFSTQNFMFRYVPTPKITALVPSSAPTTGVPVTVYGSFNDTGYAPLCRFGLTTVPIIGKMTHRSNASFVVCDTPEGSSAVNVEISLNGGSDYTNDQFNFGYYSVDSLSPRRAPAVGGTLVIISGSGFQPSPLAQCRFGSVKRPAQVLSAAQVRCLSPTLVPGNVAVQYSADGKVSTINSLTFTIIATPELRSIVPQSAREEGGTVITVLGINFANDTYADVVCRFGVVLVPVIEVSATHATCIAPPATGALSIDMSFNGGVFFTKSGLSVSYFLLRRVYPSSGPVSGGTEVTLSGEGFTSQSFVKGLLWCRFNATVITKGISRVDDATMSCPSPPFLSPGTYPLTVSANGIDYVTPLNFTYVVDPSWSSVYPRTLPGDAPLGENSVAIRGANFPLPPVEVIFYCRISGSVVPGEVVSDTLAKCKVPRGVGTGEILMTFNDGRNIVPLGQLSYFQMTSFKPRFGPVAGGTVISVFGQGFTTEDGASNVQCRFGKSAVVPATILSSSSVTCTTPAVGPEGAQLVEVTTNGESFARLRTFEAQPPDFFFYALPTVTAIFPLAAPTAGGDSVTLYGSGFASELRNDTYCRFGSPTEPSSLARYVSPTEIICTSSAHKISNQTIFIAGNQAQFQDTGFNFTFTACPAGQFSLTFTEACQLCPPGTYAPVEETKRCITCPTNSFAENYGSVACTPCPENSDIPTAERNNRTFCECQTGFYSLESIRLRDAALKANSSSSSPAPPGGGALPAPAATVSPSATPLPSSPSPVRFLWGLQEAVDNLVVDPASGDGSGGNGSASGNDTGLSTLQCIVCPRGAQCFGGLQVPVSSPGFWADPGSPDLFMKCDVPESCPGGVPGTCFEGYTGRLCAGCSPGYYSLNNRCTKCPRGAGYRLFLFFIFGILLALGLIKSVGRNASASGGTIGIATFFFQVLAMLAKLQLRWPYRFRLTLEIITMPFTLNLDLMATECAFPAKYETKWLGMYMLPLVYLTLFVILYFLGLVLWMFSCLVNPCRRRKVADLEQDTYHIIGGARELKRIEDEPIREIDIRNRIVNAFCQFMLLVYILPVTLSFELFDCTLREDGEWTLDASPSHICYQKWWYSLATFAGVGILFYAIVLPLLTVAFFFYNRKKLDMPYFISRYGSLFTDFKPTLPFWEAVLMWQKVLMLIPILYFTNFPEFQIASFLLVLFLSLTVNLVMRPFFLERYNRLQTSLRWCACLMLLLGMAIRMSNEYTAVRERLSRAANKAAEKAAEKGTSRGSNAVLMAQQNMVLGICFMMLAFSVVIILMTIIFDITVIHWELRRKIAPTILQNIDRLMHPHGKTIVIQWLGKGNKGQDFEDPLGIVLNSIAAERAHRQLDPFNPPPLTAVDKFVDMYTGICFTTPLLPVVRQWILARIERSSTSTKALRELTLFGETFAQLNRFRVKMISSRSVFPRIGHGVSRAGADAYANCVRDNKLFKEILVCEEITKALYFGELVSDACVKAIVRQAHRHLTVALQNLRNAHITMLALDQDDITLHPSGLRLGSDGVPRKQQNADVDLVNSQSHLLSPYLHILYEGSLQQHAIDNIVQMMKVSTNASKSMLSRVSPFPYLHKLYISLRDEKDEEQVTFIYVDEGFGKREREREREKDGLGWVGGEAEWEEDNGEEEVLLSGRGVRYHHIIYLSLFSLSLFFFTISLFSHYLSFFIFFIFFLMNQ